MPKVFPITVGELQFHPASFSHEPLLATLRHLEGLEYRFECRGPRNGYQLDSTLDVAAKQQLLASGCRAINFAPRCPVAIDFDFVLDVHGDKIVFEIEKANKEKLLYDFLKMHIYLQDSEISAAVLVVPVNWAHSWGVQDLFSFARERFDLCKTYGMADSAKAQRMLIVGASAAVIESEIGIEFCKGAADADCWCSPALPRSADRQSNDAGHQARVWGLFQ